MAKQAVTYIGTHDDPTTEITFGGQTFKKGEVVQMDDKDPSFEKISNNPTFAVGGEARSSASDAKKEAAELEKVRNELNSLNVTYEDGESIDQLNAKLAEAKQAQA